MKKKLFAFLMAGLMALALAGCGGADKKAPAKTDANAKKYTPATVRVAYMPNMKRMR